MRSISVRALSLRSRLRYCNRPFRHASMAQSGKSTEFFARIAQKTMRLKHKHNLLLARYAYALYMTQMTYSRDTKTIEADSLPQSPHNRGECQKAFLSVVSAMILIVFEISGKLFRRVRIAATPCFVIDYLAFKPIVAVDVRDETIESLELRRRIVPFAAPMN